MPQITAAEKMLKGKRSLIRRLEGQLKYIQQEAAEETERVKARIRIAQSLVDALEKGTLRP